ncbi:MAG: TIGR02099 family protein [Betaproteobacteria bacterium]|nr:TIGR02099 family protein [Betaproteobacteria bacterium]
MAYASLRHALYHRLSRLLPFFASPAARRFWHGAWRVTLWGVCLTYFGFAVLLLGLRYWVLPQVGAYRGEIEHMVSQAVGLPVTIGRIDASWRGLRPDLSLSDVRIADKNGRPALAFSQVDSVLSWWSVPTLQLRLHLLEINEPTLLVRREADGHLFVAGIPVDTSGQSGGAAAWILSQERIHVRDATIVWEDAQRGAPALPLEAVNLLLENDGSHHRFGLTALPPADLAPRLDLRGDLRGKDPARLADWSGQLYTEFDYTDLAAWQAWVDYPVSLPRGQGALRLWVGLEGGALTSATADVALRDVRLRLAKNLPELDLAQLQGHVAGARGQGGFLAGLMGKLGARGGDLNLSGRRLTLTTRDGLHLAPTDFSVTLNEQGERRRGNATATTVDLGGLAALAGYLPLEDKLRQLLVDYAPAGRLQDLKASWALQGEALQEYAVTANFEQLALKANGAVPGFAGLSGKVDATERGGSLALDAQQAAVDLPRIFPEPRIALDTLAAQLQWKVDGSHLEVDLDKLTFTNPDATGSAQGTYRIDGPGPGNINLTAGISQADGKAVWRYMPLVVSQDARDWLKTAITGGTASEAKLVLKGDLARFPFRKPGEGQFLVTAKINGASLDYGTGWPKIDDIQGSLRFEGARMLIEAKSGKLLGARLNNVKAEIADLELPDEVLKATGKAEGPTAEFLKFIDQSPVGDKIDNFTEDMRAQGDGHLTLALTLPLRHIVDTKVSGDFDFLNNQVTVEPGLPPLTQVNGRLHFSDSGIHIKEVTAQAFGAPLRISASNEGDKVLVNAQGSASIAALRRSFDLPILDNLSGTTPWKGEIRVRKKTAELVVESDLKGIASSLPEPFNKSATQALPLRLERASLAEPAAKNGKAAAMPQAPAQTVPREQIKFSLGKLMTAQIIRRKEATGSVTERGAIAVGEAPVLPDRGLVLAINQPAVDVDFWRRALLPTGSAGGTSGGGLPLTLASLKTPQLDVGGRRLHDVSLRAAPAGNSWQVEVTSREAAGLINWEGEGRGKLKARLKHLILPEATPRQAASVKAGEVGETLDELPALDVVADNFSIGIRRFGRLDLQARNEGRLWRLDKVGLSSPEGSLVGSGQWRIDLPGGSRTQLDFELVAGDVGKYLDRIGYPGTVKRGSATLAGKLAWNGSPTSPDFSSLSGDLKLSAERGQFAKLEPGIGKLIGLLSLQSLPRRITLDFRDVFSDGFAFDSIDGTFQVHDGLMKTSDLAIDGPAAKVNLKGEVNVSDETQNLKVRVQPALGSTLALGTAVLAHPVVGVATLLAQKILQNPLDQVFAFEYQVSGTWDDPKVEKLGSTPVPVKKDEK